MYRPSKDGTLLCALSDDVALSDDALQAATPHASSAASGQSLD
jgi:hypothetical protein